MAVLQRPPLPFPSRALEGLSHAGGRRFLIAGVVALVVLGALLQVNQFSRVTSTGYQINQLTRERAQKQAANHQIEAEVAKLSSLARVDIEARTKLGMVPPDRRLTISVNQPTPGREAVPLRFMPPQPHVSDALADSSERWWKRLLKLTPFF